MRTADAALDRFANYLATHPRVTTIILCSLIVIVMRLDMPR